MEEINRFQNNAIFWIEVERIKPNPYQPRRDFDGEALQSLADSIRQYGVLQPLVVTRFEIEKEDGGLATEYELISGERRWRASRLAGLSRVPALIREKEDSDKVKLELAIIENLQREDLNPIERAEAFHKLVDEFGFKHTEVAKKVGKSREYVSNSLRLLALPEDIRQAIVEGKITEGHARPLLMVGDKPEEQSVLFKEVYLKKLTVRETEDIARRIAHDKVRKKVHEDPRLLGFEKELSDTLGTRVRIEQKATGGKITIDFFSDEDLRALLHAINDQINFGEEVQKEALVEEIVKNNIQKSDDVESDEAANDDAYKPSPVSETGTGKEETQDVNNFAPSPNNEPVNPMAEEGSPHMGDSSYGESVNEPDVDVQDGPERIERKHEFEKFEHSLDNREESALTESDIENADFDEVKEDVSEKENDEDSSPSQKSDDDDDEDLYSLSSFSL